MDQTPTNSVYYTASESGEPATPYPYQTPRTTWESSEIGTTPRARDEAIPFQTRIAEAASDDDSTIVVTPRAANWALPFPRPRLQDSPGNSSITSRRYVSNPTSMPSFTPIGSRIDHLASSSFSKPASTLLPRSASFSSVPGSPIIREVLLRDCSMSDPSYASRLHLAVERVASSLTTRGRPKESHAMKALYEQSFKDPGSANLLDAMLRRRTSERQRIDFRRYAEDVSKLGSLSDGQGQPGHNVVEVTSVRKRRYGGDELGRASTETASPRSPQIEPSRANSDEDDVPSSSGTDATLRGDEFEIRRAFIDHDESVDDEHHVSSAPDADLEFYGDETLGEIAATPQDVSGEELVAGRGTEQSQETQPAASKQKEVMSPRHSKAKRRKSKKRRATRALAHVPQKTASTDASTSLIRWRVDERLDELQDCEQRSRRKKSRQKYRMFQGANGPVYSTNYCEMPLKSMSRVPR